MADDKQEKKELIFVVRIHNLTNMPTVLGFTDPEKVEDLKKNKRFSFYSLPVKKL